MWKKPASKLPVIAEPKKKSGVSKTKAGFPYYEHEGTRSTNRFRDGLGHNKGVKYTDLKSQHRAKLAVEARCVMRVGGSFGK